MNVSSPTRNPIFGALTIGLLVFGSGGTEARAQDSQSNDVNLRPPITNNIDPQTYNGDANPIGNDPANPDEIMIRKPSLNALITIDRNIDPFRLDASGTREMNLKEAAELAISSNLDINISNLQVRQRKANLLSSYGSFLPDIALGYQYQFLKGTANIPIGQTPDPLRFNNPLIITSAGFTYYGYRGGSVMFTALRNRNNLRASKHSRAATVNDALSETARLYYDLSLQEAILQVRIRAVEVSTEQVEQARLMQRGGLATRLEILQAETQLSEDKQNLIDQQVARREAAIKLSEYLNIPQDNDISPRDNLVRKVRLVSTDMQISPLLSVSIVNRPELKQYEELRLAAKKEIMIRAAKLQPTFAFTGNVYGIGETLGDSYKTSVVTQPVVLSSGDVVGNTQIRRTNRQITPLYSLGFNVNWNFEGLGTVDLANIQAARMAAREATVERQKVLNQVVSETRTAYLHSMSTERKIEEALSQVASATEELRLARLRYKNGLGKNIDVLRAQSDYTSALIQKARALINFNIAQVRLLRDTGVLSLATLTASAPFRQ